MKGLKIKAAIIAASAVFAAFGTTAFAESSEGTHEITSDTSTSTTTSDTTTSDVSGADSDNSNGESTSSTPRVTDNPQLRAELQNDELYNYLMKYLNDPENFKADGTGILIGESNINIPKPVTSDGESNRDYNYHTENDNGEKVMYTVATRDGSIFYIVIDKSGETENVYFLNAVDAVDLAAVINRGKTESDTSYTPQEKVIIDEAGKPVSNSNEDDTSDGNSNSSKPSSSQSDDDSAQKGSSDIVLYAVIGVAAVAVIGFAAYKKVGPGKNKKAPAFDELDDDDEDNEDYEEEEFIDEDSSDE